MACLGRGAAQAHEPPGERRAAELLTVPDDPRAAAAEAAVFDALARQVTAFICNLDEATVNVGAAEPPSAPSPRPTFNLSSSSAHGSRPGAGAGSAAAAPGGPSSSASSGAGSSCGGVAADCAPPMLFRRLRAAAPGVERGFGWREARQAFEAAMRRENRCERMVARDRPAAAERRLHQRLLVARLEAVPFKCCSGGDSLFEALALAVWGSAAPAPALRALAVGHAAAHPADFRPFLGNDWEAYLAGMAQAGTPGDELMLRAAADALGLPVNIVTADAFMWLLRWAPPRQAAAREATLAFLGPCTWLPVRRQSTMSALKMSLTAPSELRAAREMRRQMQQLELGGGGGGGGGGMQPGTPPPGSPAAPRPY